MIRRWLTYTAVSLLLVVQARAQDDDDLFTGKPSNKRTTVADLISFKVNVEPSEARRGETVRVTITGTPKAGYYTYPLTQQTAGQTVNVLRDLVFETPQGVTALWPVTESDPEKVFDSTLNSDILKHKKPFTWSRDVLIRPSAVPGEKTIHIKTEGLQVCADKCTPGQIKMQAEFTVSDAPPVPLTPELEKRVIEPRPALRVIGDAPKEPSSPRTGVTPTNEKPKVDSTLPIDDSPGAYKLSLEQVQKQLQTDKKSAPPVGILTFMLQGVFWGAVSLITPCVFPMIPITVSFFLKQSEKQNHKPVTMAIVYCATIVTVLTISAIALLSVFRQLSVHASMNFALGALFVFFALSLFGMYDIELPSVLTRFTSAREGKGGLLGVVFMALTFTIVSFACVAPFLGGFGGTAGSSAISWQHRILGGLAFSVTFAAPFFVLALFPALLQKMPKSGSWLNSVKVVMGFLELAAALKFFRQAELNFVRSSQFFTYDLVLGMWIAIALLCGMYLLNVYRLPHDGPVESIGVPRLLFGTLFVSLGLYLLPALFTSAPHGEKQRPRGTVYAWIDSFLLPEPSESGVAGLMWNGNLPRAIEEARAEAKRTGQPKYVFVDFTGETCTNCKFNEKNVFTKSEIKKLFEPYSLVQMYTDKVPDSFFSSRLQSAFGTSVDRQHADAKINLEFQRDTFGTEQLPLYVILRPVPGEDRIEEVARYDEGKINKEADFAQFLRKPFEDAGASAKVTRR